MQPCGFPSTLCITAASCNLQVERYADALMIAALPGATQDLWERAQKKCMAAAPRPYMAIAKCILEGDFTGASQCAARPQKYVQVCIAAWILGPSAATVLRLVLCERCSHHRCALAECVEGDGGDCSHLRQRGELQHAAAPVGGKARQSWPQ